MSDGDGKYVVFETEVEAQHEIVDLAMIRPQEFLDGQRDFEDAMRLGGFALSQNQRLFASISG